MTERVEIGPLVASAGFHNPAVLAKKAATIEEISGGRLILGLGAGWNRPDYEAFGFPYDHRVSRFEEAFTIVRELLRDRAQRLSGRATTRSIAVSCFRVARGPAGPPLMVGSMGERMLGITLPHVAAWNAWGPWFGNIGGGLPRAPRGRVDAHCREVESRPSRGRAHRGPHRGAARGARARLPGREEPFDAAGR